MGSERLDVRNGQCAAGCRGALALGLKYNSALALTLIQTQFKAVNRENASPKRIIFEGILEYCTRVKVITLVLVKNFSYLGSTTRLDSVPIITNQAMNRVNYSYEF